ncbi:MAG: YfhO family protein [Bacteroidia bacterium]|nr:YfhO family protein [Bacteroidia bacterium]MCF8425723.1 YfhO family protein [Bacteroidia bacterium]
MNQTFFKKALPHLIAFVVIMVVIFAYFTPLFNGKVLKQYDVLQWKSTFQEIAQFEKASGERTFWTNSIFGGMPSYLIGATYHGNFTGNILFYFSQIFKNPADTIFLLFACFYILLLTFEVSPWLAIIGSLAFAMSSFNFINIDAGHVTKGNAIAFIPLVLAGIQLTLHKNKLLGAILTGIAVSFELSAGHVQITYYLIFIILAWMVVELISAFKNKTLPSFLTAGVFLAIAALVGIGTNITGLLATEEYGKYSIRGKSELTQTPTGESNTANSSSGLDKDYALSWSNGVVEPFTLLIANFYGGGSQGDLGTNSETYRALQKQGYPNAKDVVKQMPIYWGDQPFTAGPIYYGAIIVFLFVLGMFLVKGPEKWWIFSAAMLAIFLSMGKNFLFLTDIFFDYFPLYNKFRSVTFILCVSQTMFPFLAILALKELVQNKISKPDFINAMKYSLGIVGGLCLVFALLPGMFFDFTSETDGRMNFPQWLRDSLIADRESLLRMDALRSLAFILAAAAALWYFQVGKLKKELLFGILGVLVLVDLWGVDKRYLNDKDFEKKKGDVAVEQTAYDAQILTDKDPHFRVYNNTTDFDKDAITSYYHKSLGGYHGAKMRRYQELIEWQLGRQNMECYNMLNAKYFIVQDSTGNKFAQRNPFSNGNAWFVNDIKWVNNADEEINALTGFKSMETAIIDKRFEADLAGFKPSFDSTASITLTSYQPNKLEYASNAQTEQLAVFSEIYYELGWNAYLDNTLVPHFRTDYVLRGMKVPAGKHQIVFKFEPTVIATGERIAYASSYLLYGGLILILALTFFKRKKEGVE